MSIVIPTTLASQIETAVIELNDELTALTPGTDESRESVCRAIRSAEKTASDLTAQAKQLLAAAKDYEALSDLLKEDILIDLQNKDVKSEVAGDYKVSRRKNPATVIVSVDPTDLPTEYQRITVSADKRGLAKAVKAGASVDGVELHQGEHVRITLAPTK